MTDFADVPLDELADVPWDVLLRSLGNVLPGENADVVPVAAFQSSI
jgi:FXSXX-COOH protein